MIPEQITPVLAGRAVRHAVPPRQALHGLPAARAQSSALRNPRYARRRMVDTAAHDFFRNPKGD